MLEVTSGLHRFVNAVPVDEVAVDYFIVSHRGRRLGARQPPLAAVHGAGVRRAVHVQRRCGVVAVVAAAAAAAVHLQRLEGGRLRVGQRRCWRALHSSTSRRSSSGGVRIVKSESGSCRGRCVRRRGRAGGTKRAARFPRCCCHGRGRGRGRLLLAVRVFAVVVVIVVVSNLSFEIIVTLMMLELLRFDQECRALFDEMPEEADGAECQHAREHHWHENEHDANDLHAATVCVAVAAADLFVPLGL